MAKVRCNICANEISGVCKVKKIGVKLNKPRKCEAYIYEESKVKEGQEVPVTRFNYTDRMEAKKQRKEELKELRKLIREQRRGPNNGTAQDLGLISPKEESRIIKPNDYVVRGPIPGTGDSKHPLTGDLTRFVTTARGDR